METQRICSICGKPLAPNAPEGLCPECLLKAGFGTGVDLGPETTTGAPHSAFTPPSIAELAAKFPQLEILEFIGQGGMGAVYKARQKQLNRVVALKILPPQAASGPGFAERFAREARALAKLNHPHIVTLYEFGQADGLFYFLMEFVDGVNLRQLLRASRIAPKEALAIVPQICEALQFAHDEGIVHRDIKPENILLDKKGQVKIADFGVAKIVAEGLTEAAGTAPPSSAELTAAGSALGTPQYMAPEQIKNSAEVDHRADIYSLGVVFYQMLTGELPAGKIEPPSKKVTIDVRLDEIVLRALEKKPELRYQQASVLKTEVETITGAPGTPGLKTPTPLFPTSFGLVFRSRAALYLARAGWILGCLGALGFLGFISGSRHLKGLFGLTGFFGLIGIAVLMEFIYRSNHQANQPVRGSRIAASGPQPVRPLSYWRWIIPILWLIGLLVAAAITITSLRPAPQTAAIGTFSEFTNRLARELGVASFGFDGAYISAATNDYFVVSFSGLRELSRPRDNARNPTGSLGAHHVDGKKWAFQGLEDLWNVHFDIADLNADQVISSAPALRNLGEANKGEIIRTFQEFTTLVARELDRVNVRFDNLYISSAGPGYGIFSVSFHGLQQITPDKSVQDIDGSLEARHAYEGMPPPLGAKWEFQGMQALSKVHFEVASLDSVKLISRTFRWQRLISGQEAFVGPLDTADLKPSVTAVAAHKGDINVYISALGEVESSNTVSFPIAEDYVQQVVRKFDAGQKLAVEAFDGHNGKFGHGTLTGVDNQIDVNTGTLKCRANLVPDGAQLMIRGLFLNIHLVLETKHDVILVPNVAVQRDPQSAYVWVINSDHKVTRRPVKTGTSDNDVTEVQDGLAPGEMVATDGFNDLQEGITVSLRPK